MSTYQSVLPDLEDTLRRAVRGFAEWHAKEGGLTAEQWKRDFAEPLPQGDYFAGFNAGVESVLLAVDLWLEEMI